MQWAYVRIHEKSLKNWIGRHFTDDHCFFVFRWDQRSNWNQCKFYHPLVGFSQQTAGRNWRWLRGKLCCAHWVRFAGSLAVLTRRVNIIIFRVMCEVFGKEVLQVVDSKDFTAILNKGKQLQGTRVKTFCRATLKEIQKLRKAVGSVDAYQR